WMTAFYETVDGVKHTANVPTEEGFTTPDPEVADGHARPTRPLGLRDGTVLRDLVLRFSAGRVVGVEAASGKELLERILRTDEGAARLGEVALVDADSRVARVG